MVEQTVHSMVVEKEYLTVEQLVIDLVEK